MTTDESPVCPQEPETAEEAKPSPASPLPRRVTEKLRETFIRLRGVQVAQLVWDRVLTPQQRKQLGDDFGAALQLLKGPLPMYRKFHDVPTAVAVANLGKSVGFLTSDERLWLLREVAACDASVAESLQRPATQLAGLPEKMEEEIEIAAIERTLVVVSGPSIHAVYWYGHLVDAPWRKHGAIWQFVVCLAKEVRHGGVVDWQTLGASKQGVPRARKHRLKKLLAESNLEPHEQEDFLDSIESVPVDAYKLKLSPQEIEVFNLDASAWEIELPL